MHNLEDNRSNEGCVLCDGNNTNHYLSTCDTILVVGLESFKAI